MRWQSKIINGQLLIEGVDIAESGAEIHALTDGTFDLYEIPMYGGNPSFVKNGNNLYTLMEEADSWT